MNKLIFILSICLLVNGCAGAALKSEWKEKRGYADSDIEEIMKQSKDYLSMQAKAQAASSAFDRSHETEANSRLKNIFCACVKKMGASCRSKEGSGIDRTLWVKANAVDFVMNGGHWGMTFEKNSMSVIDTDECN